MIYFIGTHQRFEDFYHERGLVRSEVHHASEPRHLWGVRISKDDEVVVEEQGLTLTARIGLLEELKIARKVYDAAST